MMPRARQNSLNSLGLGFRVWGLGFRVWGLGFRVWGLGLSKRSHGSERLILLELRSVVIGVDRVQGVGVGRI